MTKEEFNNKLKELDFSKKDFCELSGLPYGTVANWGGNAHPVPVWVDSWLDNYKSRKVLDTVITAIDSVREHKFK